MLSNDFEQQAALRYIRSHAKQLTHGGVEHQHAALRQLLPPDADGSAAPLVPVKDPPPVQVLLPGFTRVDAATYVDLTNQVRLQLNVENVFDRQYYPMSHGNNNIMPGAPRTLRVGLNTTM